MKIIVYNQRGLYYWYYYFGGISDEETFDRTAARSRAADPGGHRFRRRRLVSGQYLFPAGAYAAQHECKSARHL